MQRERYRPAFIHGCRIHREVKLIVGLGNPGKKYEKTRHNCGFMVIDELARQLNIPVESNKFQGIYGKGKVNGDDVILLKPQTYMNLSGDSLIQFMNYFKVAVEDIVVVYDDLDLPVGKIRLRAKGSPGGHNGIKSIVSHLKTQNFNRVRVGIDKDKFIPVIDYVLGKFTKEQEPLLLESIAQASAALKVAIQDDFSKAMNQYNQR